jgi:hypothetical protein
MLEVVVKITVSVQGAHSQADTRALYKALFNAPAARQGAHVSQVTAPVRPSDMGSTLDVIEFAVGAGFKPRASCSRSRRGERQSPIGLP